MMRHEEALGVVVKYMVVPLWIMDHACEVILICFDDMFKKIVILWLQLPI